MVNCLKVQRYTPYSDIDWSKSISEIDQEM